MVREGSDHRRVTFLVGLTRLIIATDVSIVAVALFTLRPTPATPAAGLAPS